MRLEEELGVAPSQPGDAVEEPRVGSLVLVGTPIGNLSDLSERAKNTLMSADCLVAEDTRNAKKLLSYLGIKGQKTVSLYGERRVEARRIAEWVVSGQVVALTSDAGMPGVSDPGAEVVKEVRLAGAKVTVVPGPSALTSAIALCDFPVDDFRFVGFLDKVASKRREALKTFRDSRIATVAFEAPHRIAQSVADIKEIYGENHRMLLAKELTKLYETSLSASVGEIEQSEMVLAPRGEYVMVLSALSKPELSQPELIRVFGLLSDLNLGAKATSDLLANLTGVSKNDAYALYQAERSKR